MLFHTSIKLHVLGPLLKPCLGCVQMCWKVGLYCLHHDCTSAHPNPFDVHSLVKRSEQNQLWFQRSVLNCMCEITSDSVAKKDLLGLGFLWTFLCTFLTSTSFTSFTSSASFTFTSFISFAFISDFGSSDGAGNQEAILFLIASLALISIPGGSGCCWQWY